MYSTDAPTKAEPITALHSSNLEVRGRQQLEDAASAANLCLGSTSDVLFCIAEYQHIFGGRT